MRAGGKSASPASEQQEQQSLVALPEWPSGYRPRFDVGGNERRGTGLPGPHWASLIPLP